MSQPFENQTVTSWCAFIGQVAGMADGQRYYAYLLRVWLAGDNDQPHWRASLEDTHSGERRGFASLVALCEYLDQQTGLLGEIKNDNQEGSTS
jgi:hypothetical protein